jgi:2-dehydro-3-deoxyphosphooctonate aldolase (KDO 8-P synthase)
VKLLNWEIGKGFSFFLIAGPCVIESRELALQTAEYLKRLTDKLDIPFIYKSSFDKANRTSSSSPRGPGIEEGLKILEEVRSEFEVPVITDIHTALEASIAAEVVDMLQTPAFLCRQTDLIQAAAKTGKPINIKKGQFLSPHEMMQVVEKAFEAGARSRTFVCERGTTFGYNNLVVDMRSLKQLRETGCPVVFDATHSVQQPGGRGDSTGGQRQYIPSLARAAVAVGIDGLFLETHPDPDKAWSDGPNSWPLLQMESLLQKLVDLDKVVNRVN